MIINPKMAITEGYIKHRNLSSKVEDWEDFLSPNGIDFTLDKVFITSGIDCHSDHGINVITQNGKHYVIDVHYWINKFRILKDVYGTPTYCLLDYEEDRDIINDIIERPPIWFECPTIDKEIRDSIISTGYLPPQYIPVGKFGKNKVTVYYEHNFTDSNIRNVFSKVDDINLSGPDFDGWYFAPHTSYDCMSDFYLELPKGIAATLIIRSSLNRYFATLTSGLYDSGFKGNIGFILHIGSVPFMIEKGARVGQIVFHYADTDTLYKGGYNTSDGQHWYRIDDVPLARPISVNNDREDNGNNNTE